MAIEVAGYDQIEEVARGGFGVVYRARQVGFDRTVALKVLSQLQADDHAARRWQRECQAMGALSWHPNIVAVYDLGTTGDGHPYLAMEFLDRGSLADRLLHLGPLSWEEAVNMTIQVSGALQAAHDAGVLHRDLKPENVMVGLYGEAKLTDFGLATSETAVATAAGMASFTIAHAAPEALQGERVGPPGDVYSLGSTLFHLLAGRPPFLRQGDENVLAAVTRVVNDPLPDLRGLGVPESVAAAVEAATAKDPAARPTTPADLGRLLQEAQHDAGLAVTEMRLDPRGEGSGRTLAAGSRPAPPPPADGEDSGPTVRGPRPAAPTTSSGPADAPAAASPVAPPAPAAPPLEPAASPPEGPGATPPPLAAGPPPEAGTTGPAAAGRSRRPLLIGVVAVAVLLVVVVAVVALAGGGGDGGGGDDDQADDGAVGAVVATIPVGDTPRGIVVDDLGIVWVANRGDATVSRVDPATDEVTSTVDVGEGPRDVAVGLGSVWVTSLEAAEVSRLSASDGTVLDTVAFDGGPQSVTTADGLVWVTDRDDATVEGLDPDTLETVEEIAVGADPAAIVADGDATLWVTNREDGTLSKIDLDERAVVATVDVGDLPGEATVDGDDVWLAVEGTRSVLRVDAASAEVVETIEVGERVGAVAIDDQGRPWVDGDDDLLLLDPDAGSVVGSVEVEGQPREVAAGDGSIWSVPHDAAVLTRVDPS